MPTSHFATLSATPNTKASATNASMRIENLLCPSSPSIPALLPCTSNGDNSTLVRMGNLSSEDEHETREPPLAISANPSPLSAPQQEAPRCAVRYGVRFTKPLTPIDFDKTYQAQQATSLELASPSPVNPRYRKEARFINLTPQNFNVQWASEGEDELDDDDEMEES